MGCGAFCRRSAIAVHASIEAPVSCDQFWNTRFDVENLPRLTRHVQSVELLAGATAKTTKAGLKWREHRIYNGRSVGTIMTVTRVETCCSDGALYCGHYSVCFDQDSWERVQANQTGSLSVYPLHEDTACRVVLTVNFIAEGYLAALFFKLVGWCARRYAVAYTTEELEEIAAAAVKRQASTSTPKTGTAVSEASAVGVVSG